jgi:protein-S-isoprenylcysteine O-methyltransferase Ste14
LLGAVILGPLAVAAALSPPRIPESEPLAWLLNAGAWVCFLLYAGIRIWATLFIGGNKDLRLQTDGPYSVCRNPLYVGSFCFALALTFMLKSATFATGVILAFVIYLNFVVRAEEHFLSLRFGEDFANYCRRTPRFWPRWSSLISPTHLRVDMKRLKQECVRLSRAALVPILLEVLMKFRSNPEWPHWFFLL